MPDETYDVAIVGAGSAGTMLAEQLRIDAPDLRLALFERRAELTDATRVIHADIVDIEPGHTILTLITNSEQKYFARKVVFATGQFPPGDP